MNSQKKLSREMEDPMLGEALSQFKASIDAWSEAAYHRPRTVAGMNRHRWRLAAGWALGSLLAFGSLAGGVYQRFHSQDLARIAALKTAEQKAAGERLTRVEKLAAAEKALEQRQASEQADAATRPSDPNEDLMATLDIDVSREVPAAMEPLAQLIDDSGAKDTEVK